MTLSKPILFLGPALSLLILACAHSAPSELVAARTAFERASVGPSQQYTPAELHSARESLLRAERLFEDEGATNITRDQAYIALRQAERAQVLARAEVHRREAQTTIAQAEQLRQRDFARTRGELDAQRAAGTASQEELVAERRRREEAERRAAMASAELARLASVTQEERGTVITLPGGVLFATGKDTLKPGAQARLNQVAEALMQGDPEAKFLIEGHTDSTGGEALNQRLSEQRAAAVREYLIDRGVPSDRIVTEGLGQDRPIADNESPDGRAMNRRVEIVIQPGEARGRGRQGQDN